ncbi:MAG: guanylate kinase [Lachnospiraceae bacterium]|nr:guanylate kinase [Lachnospiraceae bacterium]
MSRQGILTVVSGFSGAGKGTLMKALLAGYGDYALSISATTRSPREGEVDGKDYFFVSTERFLDMISGEQLIEYAQYQDKYYGTPKEYVDRMLSEGRDVILEIEVQGAAKVRARYPEALLLFVTPPSAEELERRLKNRGTETAEQIAGRMSRAAEEAKYMPAYDYIIMNDKLDDCVKQLHSVIQNAKQSTSRCGAFMSRISNELQDLLKEEN